MTQHPDARQFAPATQRNREPILAILQRILPPTGTVLEISSGTGEHAIFFAPALHPRQWLPSDPDPIARASVTAWSHECPTENLHPPLTIDAREAVWAIEQPEVRDGLATLDLEQHPIQAIANINMIHISPWAACLGLMAGAERLLPSGSILYLYGPFKQNGQHTAPSNEAFDASLRWQNPQWGVRDLEEVAAIAQSHQLALTEVVPMPANNFSVIFHKT